MGSWRYTTGLAVSLLWSKSPKRPNKVCSRRESRAWGHWTRTRTKLYGYGTWAEGGVYEDGGGLRWCQRLVVIPTVVTLWGWEEGEHLGERGGGTGEPLVVFAQKLFAYNVVQNKAAFKENHSEQGARTGQRLDMLFIRINQCQKAFTPKPLGTTPF